MKTNKKEGRRWVPGICWSSSFPQSRYTRLKSCQTPHQRLPPRDFQNTHTTFPPIPLPYCTSSFPHSSMNRTLLLGVWLALLLALTQAQNSSSSSPESILAEKVSELEAGINATWLLLTGMIVFMMQAGFAILGMWWSIINRYNKNYFAHNTLHWIHTFDMDTNYKCFISKNKLFIFVSQRPEQCQREIHEIFCLR